LVLVRHSTAFAFFAPKSAANDSMARAFARMGVLVISGDANFAFSRCSGDSPKAPVQNPSDIVRSMARSTSRALRLSVGA
jgi:hypothetical protein